MARLLYGNTPADFTLSPAGKILPNVPLTVWSAREGGTQITDLLNYAGEASAIITSDISTKVLNRAIAGVYPMKAVEKIPRDLLKKYFLKGTNANEGYVRVSKALSSAVTFERVNLMEPFPFSTGFDVIFCRNVMIYFDAATREHLVRRFFEATRPGGHLIIGHSESLNGIDHRYRYVKPTIYRREG